MLTDGLNAWTVILLYFCMSYGWCWQHSRGTEALLVVKQMFIQMFIGVHSVPDTV